MKNLYVFILLLFAAVQVNAQHTHHDVAKLDDQVELAMDTAAKHMCLFILTQNVKQYESAMANITHADSLNKSLVSILNHEKSLGTPEMKSEIQERSEEFQSYYKTGIKEEVLAEKPADRKIKYKFHGKSYLIGKNSEKWINQFVEFLPAN